ERIVDAARLELGTHVARVRVESRLALRREHAVLRAAHRRVVALDRSPTPARPAEVAVAAAWTLHSLAQVAAEIGSREKGAARGESAGGTARQRRLHRLARREAADRDHRDAQLRPERTRVLEIETLGARPEPAGDAIHERSEPMHRAAAP